MKISSFGHICETRLHVILFSAFSNLKSTSWKTHQSYAIYQNDISFSFLITKVTKWWNFEFGSFNNIKYKFFVILHYVCKLLLLRGRGHLISLKLYQRHSHKDKTLSYQLKSSISTYCCCIMLFWYNCKFDVCFRSYCTSLF